MIDLKKPDSEPNKQDLEDVNITSEEKSKEFKWPKIGKYDLNDEQTRTKVFTWIGTGIIILIAAIWILSTILGDAAKSIADKEQGAIEETLLEDPVIEIDTSKLSQYDPYNQNVDNDYVSDEPEVYDPNDAYRDVKNNEIIMRDESGEKQLITVHVPLNYKALKTYWSIEIKPTNYDIGVDGNDPISIYPGLSPITAAGFDLSTVELGKAYNMFAYEPFYIDEYEYYTYTFVGQYTTDMYDGTEATVYVAEINRQSSDPDEIAFDDNHYYELIIPVPGEGYEIIATIGEYISKHSIGQRYETAVDLAQEIFLHNRKTPVMIATTIEKSPGASTTSNDDLTDIDDDIDITDIDEELNDDLEKIE